MKILYPVIIFLCVFVPNLYPQEIHCKHFFYGIPKGTPATNDIIVRDIYALSSNDETKFADWVCYILDNDTVSGNAKSSRRWKADLWLADNETLEPDDYTDASETLDVDRGHQAPLADFKGTPYWTDTNYLSNITPQKKDLNQGSWKNLEEYERKLATQQTIYIMTGPYYDEPMTPLPRADEPHKVPSGYWKIIVIPEPEIKVMAFMFSQDTPRNEHYVAHRCTVDEIEAKTGLDFMSDLPDAVEELLESQKAQ